MGLIQRGLATGFCLVVAICVMALSGGSAWAAGSVYVSSAMDNRVEAGARILVDGAETGQVTPATIEGLAAGKRVITVQGDCQQGEVEVNVVDGVTERVTVEMAQAAATLIVQVMPLEASVELDGTAMTGTPGAPISVSCGSHTVAASMEGYTPVVLTVQVEMGDQVTVPLELTQPGEGRISVQVDPARAVLTLDGEKWSKSRNMMTIPAGPHMLGLTHDGYRGIQEPFVLEDGQHHEFSFVMEPLPGASNATASGFKQSNWLSTQRVGMMLTVVGAGTSAYAGFEYMQALRNYREYTGLRAEAQAGLMQPSEVNAYYDDNVAPHGNRFYVSAGVGSLLLASGVTMIVAF